MATLSPADDDAPPSLQIPTPTSNLPPYPEMIMAAIEALNEKEGSSKTEISKQIELTYPDLPATHATLITHHLNIMKQTAQLTLVKNNYMKPDPNAPPKRGRGRPPKPKDHPTPTGTVVSSPRPRGRPPKSKDPFAASAAAVAADTAPEASPSKKNPAPSGSTGRPRGRPPKKARTDDDEAPPAAAALAPVAPAAQDSVPAGGAPRGRGRPPKVKPAVAPVAG